jgi:hypothetical protein
MTEFSTLISMIIVDISHKHISVTWNHKEIISTKIMSPVPKEGHIGLCSSSRKVNIASNYIKEMPESLRMTLHWLEQLYCWLEI